ncbi:iron-containing alcohol dehydrogenase [Candidatus Solincola tengchongensis]|uniref:iron-containing alcohol dehydrogenase n=1 Tax=Candidatus Solincola tengchongensis TaxID=2900693 RepID=UPI00257CA4CA|nr:iron-containing alcohol dehydrogenase [Candidatus Solincola tengchongensis]
MKAGWEFGRSPRVVFGPGVLRRLGEEAAFLGRRVLLVTGASSLQRSGRLDEMLRELSRRSLEVHRLGVRGEPSPETVDRAVLEHRGKGIDLVVAVGGGSVLDADKAVSAMLPLGDPVEDYLEGVGKAAHPGKRLPFIAVPTTAGTGSEATNNAVISRVGENGFKRSLRHPSLFPDLALVDPELTLTCPAELTAACGMDALTQLLEAFLSPRSGPLTDALALSGMEKVREGLLAAVTRANVEALSRRSGEPGRFLEKYAKAGEVLSGKAVKDGREGCRVLLNTLEKWSEEMRIPRLSAFGIEEKDLHRLAEETSLKDNPVTLPAEERFAILASRL